MIALIIGLTLFFVSGSSNVLGGPFYCCQRFDKEGRLASRMCNEHNLPAWDCFPGVIICEKECPPYPTGKVVTLEEKIQKLEQRVKLLEEEKRGKD
jgi:hypothetical protein